MLKKSTWHKKVGSVLSGISVGLAHSEVRAEYSRKSQIH